MWFVKFDGNLKWYVNYLNQKERKSSFAEVKFLNPTTYGILFWDQDSHDSINVEQTGKNTELLIDSSGDVEMEELMISGYDDLWNTGDVEDEIDVFDPEFEDDFEAFFAGEEVESDLDDVDVNVNNSEFGFNITWDKSEHQEEKPSVLDMLKSRWKK